MITGARSIFLRPSGEMVKGRFGEVVLHTGMLFYLGLFYLGMMKKRLTRVYMG